MRLSPGSRRGPAAICYSRTCSINNARMIHRIALAPPMMMTAPPTEKRSSDPWRPRARERPCPRVWRVMPHALGMPACTPQPVSTPSAVLSGMTLARRCTPLGKGGDRRADKCGLADVRSRLDCCDARSIRGSVAVQRQARFRWLPHLGCTLAPIPRPPSSAASKPTMSKIPDAKPLPYNRIINL